MNQSYIKNKLQILVNNQKQIFETFLVARISSCSLNFLDIIVYKKAVKMTSLT